jgi:hypothetical protein
MIAPPSMYAQVGRMLTVIAQVVTDRFASTGGGRPVVRVTRRRRVTGTTPLVAYRGEGLSALVANVSLPPSASSSRAGRKQVARPRRPVPASRWLVDAKRGGPSSQVNPVPDLEEQAVRQHRYRDVNSPGQHWSGAAGPSERRPLPCRPCRSMRRSVGPHRWSNRREGHQALGGGLLL